MITDIITQNSLLIGIIIVGAFVIYFIWMHWNKNKKDILKKVSDIQSKYKMPKQP
jgi:hypothetical protein